MDQCVHLVLVRAVLVDQVPVVLVVQGLVAPVAGQVVLAVLVLVVLVAVSAVLVVLVAVDQVAVLVVLEAVALVAVLADAVTVNAVHQRRSRVHVVVKTSMKCCHKQPRRIRRAMHQFLKELSLSNVVLRRKSSLQS